MARPGWIIAVVVAVAALDVGRGSADEASQPVTPKFSRGIEEIVVTAQKREERLRDVPISMSVFDADSLDDAGITDFRDLAIHTPNAVIDSGSNFTDIRMRGFGSQIQNKAFEQSVGLSIDGIPYGRSQYFLGPLFDVERIEVLRGPQGTLFGKNTTAGLFHVVTRKPTADFTGVIDLEIGELDRRRIEAAAGGPIVGDLVHFRASMLSDERDGTIDNTSEAFRPEANERLNSRDRKGVRGQLGLPNVAGGEVRLSYEHVEMEVLGNGFELLPPPPNAQRFWQEWDPTTDFVPDNFVGSVDEGEFATYDFDTVVASASYALEDWRLEGVGGWSEVSARGASDADFGPAPIIPLESADRNPQATVELRALSPALRGFLGLANAFGWPLGDTNVIGGIFLQRRSIRDSRFAVGFNTPALAQFAAFQALDGNLPTVGTIPVPTAPLPPPGPIEDFIGPDVRVGNFGVFDTREGLEQGTLFFDQRHDALAAFGQIDWQVRERWALQYGMRLSHEKKKAHWNRVTTAGTGIILAAVNQEEFTLDRTISGFVFTPDVSLKHVWSDELNVYVRWAKGFKAGGFNEFALNDEQQIQFEDEASTSWELGAKLDLIDFGGRLNVGLFRQDVKDLQVLTILPAELVPQVLNAGEARSQGVEIDASWLPVGWLTLQGALAFTDSEFLVFPFGTCTQDRPNTDGDADERCDHSGQPFFRTPKWSATLTGTPRFPTARTPLVNLIPFLSSAGIDWVASVTGEYRDVHFVSDTFDPRLRQPSFFRFDTSVGLEQPAANWSVRVHVENFTNEPVNTIIREVPLGPNNFAQRLEPPRLVFGAVRWSF